MALSVKYYIMTKEGFELYQDEKKQQNGTTSCVGGEKFLLCTN